MVVLIQYAVIVLIILAVILIGIIPISAAFYAKRGEQHSEYKDK